MFEGIKEFFKFVLIAMLIIVAGISFVAGLIFSGTYFSQKINHAIFKQYKYKIVQDNTYWYTNDYKEDSNSITFISNYGNKVSFKEKYQVEINYWNIGKPNIKTVIYGY